MNKTALAALLLACAITILATSAPHCPDLKCPGTEVCRATSCACGSYRPDCSCCDVCFACPGGDCSLIPPTRCSNGACKLRNGVSNAHASSTLGPHGKCP